MENRPAGYSLSVHAHKVQFTWQILVPIILVVLIALAAGILVIVNAASGNGQSELWADISVIWLFAPALLFALAFLVILITTVYGMAKLLQLLPRYTGKAQEYFTLLAAGTRRLADGSARPIVWIRQIGAVIKSIIKL
jgi:hypothetical protein